MISKIEIGQIYKHHLSGEKRIVCQIGNENINFPACGELDGRTDLIWFTNSRFAVTPETLEVYYKKVVG